MYFNSSFNPSILLLILSTATFFTLTSASIKILHAIDNNDFTLRHDFKLNQIAANTYGITKNQKTFKKTNENSKYKIKLELPSGRTYQTWVSYTKLQEGGFNDAIDIFLNEDGSDVVAFGYHPAKVTAKQQKSCNPASFKSKVKVIPFTASPGVDSERWLEQQKQEIIAKQREASDPGAKGFLQKYWMYIGGAFLLFNMMG